MFFCGINNKMKDGLVAGIYFSLSNQDDKLRSYSASKNAYLAFDMYFLDLAPRTQPSWCSIIYVGYLYNILVNA